jgi:hypothetical protein
MICCTVLIKKLSHYAISVTLEGYLLSRHRLSLGVLLVDLGLVVVAGLLDLVAQGVLGGGGTV